jgi:hypothetical protein
LPPFYNPDVITFTRKVGKTIESSALVLISNLQAFTDPLKDAELSYHVEPHTGTPYALVTWIPWDATNQVNVLWERVANNIEKDIWELPQVRTEFTKLINAPGTGTEGNAYYQWHAFVQRVVNGKVNGDEEVPGWKRESEGDPDSPIVKHKIYTIAEFNGAFDYLNDQAGLPSTGPSVPKVLASVFADLAACLSRGVASFPLATFAFRKTQILPAKFTVGLNPMVPNRIYTRTEVVDGAFPPLEFQALMPEGFYQYQAPPIVAQRDGTYQLTEEWYWSEEYDHFIYSNFGSVAS